MKIKLTENFLRAIEELDRPLSQAELRALGDLTNCSRIEIEKLLARTTISAEELFVQIDRAKSLHEVIETLHNVRPAFAETFATSLLLNVPVSGSLH